MDTESKIYLSTKDTGTANAMADVLHRHDIDYDDITIVTEDRQKRFSEFHTAELGERTDVFHAVGSGLKYGAGIGFAGGIIVLSLMGTITLIGFSALIIGPLIGAIFGSWVAGIVGLNVVNEEYREFSDDLEGGGIILSAPVDAAEAELICNEVTAGTSDVRVTIH